VSAFLHSLAGQRVKVVVLSGQVVDGHVRDVLSDGLVIGTHPSMSTPVWGTIPEEPADLFIPLTSIAYLVLR
jgi:hypothetical protein